MGCLTYFFFLVLLQFSILFLKGLDWGVWTLLLNHDSSWGTRSFDVQGLQAARSGRLMAPAGVQHELVPRAVPLCHPQLRTDGAALP